MLLLHGIRTVHTIECDRRQLRAPAEYSRTRIPFSALVYHLSHMKPGRRWATSSAKCVDEFDRFGFAAPRAGLIPYNLYAAPASREIALKLVSPARRRRPSSSCARIQPRATSRPRFDTPAAPPPPRGHFHPGYRDPRAEGRTHGLVAAGALRHVHPLGSLLHPGRNLEGQADSRHWRMDHEQRLDPGGRLQGARRRSSIPPASTRTTSSPWPSPPG